METVTVTVVGSDPQPSSGRVEGSARERKISRTRKISDALTGLVTGHHGIHQHLGQGHVLGGLERQLEEGEELPPSRKISSNSNPGVEPVDGTPRERKISRTRKISDALTGLVTGHHGIHQHLHHHPHHHGHVSIGVDRHGSVSHTDLIASEQLPDITSIAESSSESQASTVPDPHPPRLDVERVRKSVDPVARGARASRRMTLSSLLGIQIEELDGKKWPQVLAAVAANMGAFAFGTVLAWSATGIASLEETNDLGEVGSVGSWIGSIPMLGAVAACPFAGFALDTLGRRRSMLFLTVPFILGWLLIGFAQNFWMILLGRFVTGFCGGCFSIAAPIFTAETADPSIRGGLGSLFDLLMSTGMLYIFVVGVFLPWQYQAFACAVIPVAFHVIMFFVPESPRFLIQRDKGEKAEKAIYWLKGQAIHQHHVNKEIDDLKTSVDEAKGAKLSIKGMLERSLILPTATLIGIMFFCTLSGIDAVNAYTVDIFKSANSTMDPKISTIVIGIVTTIASIPTAALVDLAGRRILLMLSETVLTIALAFMGLYFYMMRTNMLLFGSIAWSDITWLPLASLVLFIIGYSLGCGPLSMMMIGELLPNRMKGLTSCIVVMTRWTLAFTVTAVFSKMREVLHDEGAYWLFGCICFTGLFYVYFCIPETKGKTLAEIQLHFAGHKQANIAIAADAINKDKSNALGGMGAYDNKIDVES